MKLIDKLPSFYNNDITRKIQEAYDIELETLRETYDDTFDQFFVDTATWGLDYWENILFIKSRFDLSIEDRRSNIKAKMRGKGTTTIEVVDVEVFSNLFSFTLSFITNDCSYNTILELDKKIEEIKPCHLEHKFEMILFNQNNMFTGSTMNTGETVTIYPYSPTDITSFGELTITTGNDRSMEKVTLYPRQEVV
ncbi:DUF2313 domain-containing protein [Clostridioides difficile]|nr:DUF2313 domain-containing protein [Clostridioides difficile]